ncbi:Coatomer subunit beta (Beta-coat protein) [Psidium guajava]|nr:Coatomer subunit beta (Beta-coat protein) [Psidium guajava]
MDSSSLRTLFELCGAILSFGFKWTAGFTFMSPPHGGSMAGNPVPPKYTQHQSHGNVSYVISQNFESVPGLGSASISTESAPSLVLPTTAWIEPEWLSKN